jgi:4-hydroxyphenylacetate 3-monooxygenase
MLSKQYIERLKQKRCVYLNGALIEDVSKESMFEGAVKKIVEYYDLQQKEPEVFTFSDSEGQHSISLMLPKSRSDLKKKRIAYKRIADLSFGMLGRTPDFINAALTAMMANAHILGIGEYANYSRNAVNYYNYCKLNNLFVGHGAVNPQIDRSKALGQQDGTHAGVKVIAWNSDGIVVSGAKMIVTLAPIADELLIFNMPGLREGDEDYAIAFALPLIAKGVRLLCRKALIKEQYTDFDHPIANKFDEIDAYLILDQVDIPWEKVFVFRDVKKSNEFYDKTKARNHTGHQGIIRGLAKAELLTGVAIELANKIGSATFLNVQEQLGELTSSIELVRGAILLSEDDADIDDNGIYNPSIQAIQAIRYYFPKWYQRMVTIIQSLAAGSMLAVPHSGDFTNDNANFIGTALKSPLMSAEYRCVLLNLAWDLSGDAFGQRQLVYEIYHAGDPARIAAGHFFNYKKENMEKNVHSILGAVL